MSKSYLEPAGDHIIVADTPRDKTIDGIELPDNIKNQEMLFGLVIFVGPEAGRTHPQDTVCFGPYAGKNIILDGVEFRIMRQGQIEAYVRTAVSGQAADQSDREVGDSV